MKILFIGDIVGNIGIKAVSEYLPILKDKYQPDIIIANGENVAPNGRGITKSAFNTLSSLGINIITMGNHVWDNDDIYDLFEMTNNSIIRPANYSETLPGEFLITRKIGAKNITVINICGQVFMESLNCPFERIDKILANIPKTHYIIVDFHAEATSEKIAMGYYLSGKVTAVIGTHTHVQTNDAQIIKEHTAYISDVGMTGSNSSVLGMSTETVIKRFQTKLPIKLNLDTTSLGWQFSAVLINTASDSTIAKSIIPIREISNPNISIY